MLFSALVTRRGEGGGGRGGRGGGGGGVRGKAVTGGGGVVGTEKEFQTMGNVLKLRKGWRERRGQQCNKGR